MISNLSIATVICILIGAYFIRKSNFFEFGMRNNGEEKIPEPVSANRNKYILMGSLFILFAIIFFLLNQGR